MSTITRDDVAAHAAVLEALDQADAELRDFTERLRRKEDAGRVTALRTATAILGRARQVVESQLC